MMTFFARGTNWMDIAWHSWLLLMIWTRKYYLSGWLRPYFKIKYKMLYILLKVLVKIVALLAYTKKLYVCPMLEQREQSLYLLRLHSLNMWMKDDRHQGTWHCDTHDGIIGNWTSNHPVIFISLSSLRLEM